MWPTQISLLVAVLATRCCALFSNAGTEVDIRPFSRQPADAAQSTISERGAPEHSHLEPLWESNADGLTIRMLLRSSEAEDRSLNKAAGEEEKRHPGLQEAKAALDQNMVAIFVPFGVLAISLLLFPLRGEFSGRLADAIPDIDLLNACVVILYFISGPALTIVNQLVLRSWMPYPFFVSTLGPIFMVIATQIAVWTGVWSVQSETPSFTSYCVDILPVSALTLISLVTTSWALRDLPVTLLQIVFSFSPLVTMILSYLRGSETPSLGVWASLALMVLFSILGVTSGMAESVSLGGTTISLLRGGAMALLSVVAEGLRLQWIQRSIGPKSVFDLVYLSMPPLAVAGIVYPCAKDFRGIVDAATQPPSHLAVLVLLGVLGVAVNFTVFWIVGRMGPVTLKVLTQTRGACLFSFSAVALHQPCGLQQSISYAGTLMTSVLYANRQAVLKLKAEDEAGTARSARASARTSARKQAV